MPSVPTVQRRAAAEALAAQERVLAQPHRSGVRAIAVDGQRSPDESGFDLSNAVTKVQPAIDLDAFLAAQEREAASRSVPPPADEVTAKIGVPAGNLVPSTETARYDSRAMSQLLEDAKAAHAAAASAPPATVAEATETDDRITTAPRRRSVVRRVTAALLFAVVMAGAFALLIVAASRAEGKLPSPAVHAAQRLLELAR